MRSAYLVTPLLMLAACTQAPPPATPSSKVFTLQSGKVVKILRVTPLLFSSGERALMLSYETEIPLDDKTALGREADEVWEKFKFDVEAAHLDDAFIDANAKPLGTAFFNVNKSFHFQYKLGSDGQWSRQN